MNTGEDIQGLRKILDLSRWISVAILCTHFYIKFYQIFADWGIRVELTDRIMLQISKTGFFDGWSVPKK